MPKLPKFPKLRADQFFSILLLSLLCLTQRGQAPAQASSQLDASQQPLRLITDVTVPVFTGSPSAELALNTFSATAIYVMDRDSATVLYQKNAHLPRFPASTMKMMTALVARELYKPDKEFTVDKEAFSTGTIVGFEVGERFTTNDLLAGLLIDSGNDAALILANHHVLGYQGFIQAMNDKAKQLHLTDTVFENASGLDKNQQASTARDLAILAHEVLKDPLLRKIVGTQQMTITDRAKGRVHTLISTNALLGKVDGVIGIKTGTTESAGENLITGVRRDGHEFIIVLLGSKDRYAETQQLLEWISQNYAWQKFSVKQ